MGTWGVGVFDNDTAIDWVCDLAEEPTLEYVLDSLTEPFDDDDASAWEEALAAAGAVAHFAGQPTPGTIEAFWEWEEADDPPDRLIITQNLVQQALKITQSSLSTNNELKQLIQESGEHEDWVQELDRLSTMLQLALAEL